MYIKKIGAFVLSLIMIAGVLPVTALASTPEAYVLPNGVTADTWEYRELVPDIECETQSTFVNRGSNRTTYESNFSVVDNGYNGKALYRKSSHFRGVAFNAANMTSTSTKDYHMSAMVKAVFLGESSKARIGVFENWSNGEGYNGYCDVMEITQNDTWVPYDTNVKIAGVKTDGTVQIGIANVVETSWNNASEYGEQVTSGNTTTYLQDIYIDDWSMRKIPTGEFADIACQVMDVKAGKDDADASDNANPVAVKNGNTITFDFTLDIDPRTVRKDNILVNGNANSDIITSAVVTEPTGNTRQTTLTLTLENMEEEAIYNVSLAGVKDAWGRDVSGTAVAYVMTAAEKPYSIYDELGSDGLWLYRELVPDTECESLTEFENRGSSDAASTLQTAIKLSEDKHSGNYSIMRTARYSTGVGFRTAALEADSTYYISAYMRSDLIRKEENMEIRPFINYIDSIKTTDSETGKVTEYTRKEGVISGSPQWRINESWNRYTGTFTMPSAYLNTTNIAAKQGALTQIGLVYNKSTGTANDTTANRIVDTMYVDDWSIRLIPEWSVYAKGYSVDGNKVVFSFDKDIDKWTVQASDITVSNGATVSAVKISTDEITRMTTLEVTLGNVVSGTDYTVTLPAGLKDAWGRAIEDVTAATFTAQDVVVNVSNGEYSYIVNRAVPAGENWVAVIALSGTDKALKKVTLVRESVTQNEITGKFTEYSDGDSITFYLWNEDLVPVFGQIIR